MSEDGSPSLRSEGSSAPPAVAPATNSAAQLASAHPLWQKAAGRGAPPPRGGGGGGGGGRGAGSNKGADGARFEPLSALALELGGFRANADGDSALFSEENESVARPARGKQRRMETEDDDDDDGGFGQLNGSDDSEDEHANRKKSRKRGEAPAAADAAMYAQAAFGGGYAASDAGESISQVSGTSSTRRKAAHKAAFPIKGIDCVGCMLVKQIAPVERFVKTHFEKMAEDALWKQAALVYVREVQEPRKKEGVLTPGWSWKDLRTHYLLHCSDHTISRTFACRQLQTMRYAVEQRMMRVDGDDRELDKSSCDLMLKIIKAESDQRNILQGLASGPGKKGNQQSTVGDAK